MNTHTIVTDIHQNVLKIRGDADCADRFVSDTRVLHLHSTDTDHRITSGYVSDLGRDAPSVSLLHLAHPGNRHPHHRGSSLDVTS